MPGYHLGWQYASQQELSLLKVTQDGQGQNASDYAMDLVLNQDVFGVILINPNATVLATEAALNGNTAYDPRGAVSFFYEEARNFYSEDQYVSLHSVRVIDAAIAAASEQFVTQLLTTAAQSGTSDTTALQTAFSGNALAYPFYYNEVKRINQCCDRCSLAHTAILQHNLRPFDQLGVSAALVTGSTAKADDVSCTGRSSGISRSNLPYHLHFLYVADLAQSF